MTVRIAALVFAMLSLRAMAQAPAAPPPVPPDVSPLYVATYIELRQSARDEGAALVKAYRDASRAAAGNLRAVAVQRMRRPGQFVVLSAWQNKAAWDAAGEGMKAHREKLHAVRNAPADDRFHGALTVGPMDIPAAAGAVYGVTHVDVIPPQKDNAIVALKALGEANRVAAGNVRYDVVQQTNRPNHFTVVEMWRSRNDYEANSVSARQREFRDKLAQMTGALYDERLYEILE
ncbi:MAG TPA: antibiotic biosynthesis monooxygenase [Burkholderiales bacterium]|nr:antibiotic biosynthesis monooxygenase [Burkholderiales bacterium]